MTLLSSVSTAAECGRISIAAFTWNSAAFLAHLDQAVLSRGFGCDAEVVPGDTVPTTQSMIETGYPDIAPEVWINSIREQLRQGVENNQIRFAGRAYAEGAEEGFWIPATLVDQYPEMATIAGVKKHAKLFLPAGQSQAVFMSCPPGWSCNVSARNLFIALELEQFGFKLVEPASGQELADSMTAAIQNDAPWFGYYWSPTALLGKHRMVKVDFGTGIDADHFRECIGVAGCLEPQATMYPPSSIWTLVSESFADKPIELQGYLAKRSFENELMNEMLAWMEANDADAERAVQHFLRTHQAVWQQWLPAEAIEKLLATL